MGLSPALARLPAAVDHFLRATLDLRVAALHRCEVEVGGVGAGGHRRGRAAAQTDQHARAAQRDQQRAVAEFDLVRLLAWMLPRPPAIMIGLW
jgi:hypothetical protein